MQKPRVPGAFKEGWDLAGLLLGLFPVLNGLYHFIRHATTDQVQAFALPVVGAILMFAILVRRLRIVQQELDVQPRLSLFFDPTSADCIVVDPDGKAASVKVGVLNSGGGYVEEVNVVLLRYAGIESGGAALVNGEPLRGRPFQGGYGLSVGASDEPMEWATLLTHFVLPKEVRSQVDTHLRFGGGDVIEVAAREIGLEIGLKCAYKAESLRLNCSFSPDDARPSVRVLQKNEPLLPVTVAVAEESSKRLLD